MLAVPMCLLGGVIELCSARAEVQTSLAAPECNRHLKMPDRRINLSEHRPLRPAAAGSNALAAVFGTHVDASCCWLAQDKKVKGRIDARNSLETYCYNMKTTIEDKLGDQLEDDDKDKVGPCKHGLCAAWCSTQCCAAAV